MASEAADDSGRLGQVKRGGLVAAVFGLVAALVALDVPLCPTAALFGVPCPGCGLTRATLSAVHGQWGHAFELHPLFWIISPIYAFAVGLGVWTYIRGPKRVSTLTWQMNRWVTIGGAIMLVLMLGLWVLRFFDFFGGPVPVETLWK